MIRKSSEKQVERKPAPFNGTGEIPVSYTQLDVYKRQEMHPPG